MEDEKINVLGACNHIIYIYVYICIYTIIREEREKREINHYDDTKPVKKIPMLRLRIE